jgi:hypothetical protein
MRWMTGISAGIGLLGLLVIANPAWAGDTGDACDCGCPAYRALVAEIDAGNPAPMQIAQCGAACAIAWGHCENQAASLNGHDRADIATLLEQFLSGASIGDAAVHDRFWSEDLVYTSSAGQRFGKPELMAGLEPGKPGDGDSPVYSARDVRIRPFGDIALLDFILIAESDADERQAFLNSGVLVREHNQWRVINWQATRKAGED